MHSSFTKTLLIFYFFIPTLTAQQNVFTSYHLLKMKYVVETAISPNGKFIAYTVHVPRQLYDKAGQDYRYLFYYDLEKSKSYGVLGNKVNIYSVGWTTDSNFITFRAKISGDKITQVYQVSLNGDDPVKLTNSVTSIIQYGLNTNGYELAYIATELRDEKKTELLEKGFDAEIYEEEYKDRNLYLINLNSVSADPKQLTKGVSVFDFKWSPDGKQIAAFIADKNLVDYSYMFKRVYLIDPKTGAKKPHLDNPGKIDQMSWSPDSKHLAFIASSGLHDAVTGSLFITNVPNTKYFKDLKNYANNFEGSIRKVAWKDSLTVLFVAEEGVDVTLSEQQIGDSERRLLIRPGKVVFSNINVSGDLISFAGNTSKHPNELYSFTLADEKLSKLTNLNHWLEKTILGVQEKITYFAIDGLEIQGVIIYPINYMKGKKYPLVVYIHGGPEHSVPNGWQTYYNRWGQIASGQDFFVFMPNYRSSSGRGIDFTMQGFGDLAGKEFNDVIDGIDYLIANGLVDKGKVGIGGGSYGGYFSAWAATKFSHRFAAAVVFVGIGDQVSKRLTTNIPFENYFVHWGIWSYENEDLLWERSPVRYALDSNTPTLILSDKNDKRVHPAQSLEIYRALKLHGKAPVRLVSYPREGHGNRKNTARLDYSLRTMRWFNYYLNSDNPKDEMPEKYLDIKYK